MSDLADRIASAKVGSRELDIELMVLLGGALDVGDGVYYGPNEAVWHTSDAAEVDGSYHMLPSPSRSLDAALALAERALGKGFFGLTLTMDEHGGSRCAVEYRHCGHVGNGPTAALALCAAILAALSPSKTGGQG
jgi:hypothetical protein